MTWEYARKSKQSGEMEGGSGILQRSAVRSLPATWKVPQRKSQGLGESSVKQKTTQIPVRNYERTVVQPKLMGWTNWANWVTESSENESQGKPVQAKLAKGRNAARTEGVAEVMSSVSTERGDRGGDAIWRAPGATRGWGLVGMKGWERLSLKGNEGVLNRAGTGQEERNNGEYPIGRTKEQRPGSEDDGLCAYFALYHYRLAGGERTKKEDFIQTAADFKKVFEGIEDIEVAKQEVLEGNDPGVLCMQYGLEDVGSDLDKALSRERFIVCSIGYPMHFYAVIRGNDGVWWDYDSYGRNKPTRLGDTDNARRYIQRKTSSMWVLV